MNVPEAHIRVTNEMPPPYFRDKVKRVYFPGKYRPANNKFPNKQNYIWPDWKFGQRKIGHCDNADNYGETI